MTKRSPVCVLLYRGWEVYLPDLILHRAQVPILYPSGTRNAHDRASFHTPVCAPRRRVFEEEASDVSIELQCKPDRGGYVTRRARDRLLLHYMLAPLLTRVLCGCIVSFFKCFTETNGLECSRNPIASSATLPYTGDLFNFHLQVAPRFPINRE